MKIVITNNSIGIDPEYFVIKVFDAIKCAAGTNNALNISLNYKEVQELAEQIRAVNWIEINVGTVKDEAQNESEDRERLINDK